MPDYKPVPVEVARQIATQFEKSIVVIQAQDPVHQCLHTTTYGVSAFEKEQAAAAGRICSRALGVDWSQCINYEDFHKDYDPARYRQCQETLQAVELFLADMVRICGSDEMEVVTSEALEQMQARVKACLVPHPDPAALRPE